jgi:hypothetical protein
MERLRRSIATMHEGARFAAAAFVYLVAVLSESDHNAALLIAQEGLALAEASGDVVASTGLRISLASITAMRTGDNAEALEHAARALHDARQLSQPTLESAALYAMAVVSMSTDPVQAIALVRESLEIARRHGIDSDIVAGASVLAHLEGAHGDARRALESLCEQLDAYLRNPVAMRTPFYSGCRVFNRIGRHDLTALCEGNSRMTLPSLSPSLSGTIWENIHNADSQTAREVLGPGRFEELAQEGRRIPPDQFVARMLGEINALLEHGEALAQYAPGTRPAVT